VFPSIKRNMWTSVPRCQDFARITRSPFNTATLHRSVADGPWADVVLYLHSRNATTSAGHSYDSEYAGGAGATAVLVPAVAVS